MLTTGFLEKIISDASSVLKVDASRCLKMRFGESGCSRCITVCPASAIDLSEGLKICKDRCMECLACTTACPTGALEPHEDFAAVLDALAAHRLPVFVIGCRFNSSQSHKQLPCLGMLSAEHLVGLYASGTAMVQLAAFGCRDCAAGPILEDLADRLRETARSARLPLDRRIHLVQREEEIMFQEEGLDRRSFFSSLRRSALHGVAEALAPALKEQPGTRYIEKSLPSRRALLLTAVDSLPAEEATAVLDAFTFSVSFNGSCDECLGCVSACPTGAIVETDHSSPSFDPARCTGCGLCSEFCLSSALNLRPS